MDKKEKRLSRTGSTDSYERPPPVNPRPRPAPLEHQRSHQSDWEDPDLYSPYDLTPVEVGDGHEFESENHGDSSFPVDPWARVVPNSKELDEQRSSDSGEDSDLQEQSPSNQKSTFIAPRDIHPNMEHNADEISQLRLLAGKLSAGWGASDFMAPALARRIRDFQFAQEKRRKKYGDERPWGILGLYDHLSSIRIDVEWAEDAARRRANGEPYMSWAEFEEGKKGHANRPWFNFLLLIVCTVLLIASIAMNGWEVESISVNPMIGPSADTLIRMGAKDTNLIVNEDDWWRLLTSALLHAGLVHYFINMLALWFVGAAIEMSHGWVAAAIIFTLSALGGTILSGLFLPEFITVGASGGIFGYIGACLADIILNWKLLFCDFVTENGTKHRHAMVVVALLFDIALNSIIGLTPFVDNFTHLGGMVFGFLCGLSTIERLSTDFFGMEESLMSQTKHFIVRFFGLIVTVVTIVVTLVILLQGDGESTPCPKCTWLSCVPFPPWEGDKDKWWYCDDCTRVTAELVATPSIQLELDCPSGAIATIDLSNESDVNREKLQRELPSYCREYCHSPQPTEEVPLN